MICYSVILKRHEFSTRPNIVLCREEEREEAISKMKTYVKQNGFTVLDSDGRFTLKDVVLVEQEPIVGSPIIKETPYIEICGDIKIGCVRR